MKRKYYGFTNSAEVAEYVASVKTLDDLRQLAFDIRRAGTNQVVFQHGNPGVFSVDDVTEIGEAKRHVFVFKSVADKLRIKPAEVAQMASLTILEDE